MRELRKKPFTGKTIKKMDINIGETTFYFTDGTSVTIVVGPNGWGRPEMFIKTEKWDRDCYQ